LLFQDHHLKEDKEKKTLSSECRFQWTLSAKCQGTCRIFEKG
jgi:hypothetical protein